MLINRIDGAWIAFADGPRPMTHNGETAAFLDGWRPLLAYSGLAPVTLVPFESDDGGVGLWLLDETLERRAGALNEAPAAMLAEIVAALCPLLDGIWQELMLSRRPAAMTDAQRAFLALPEHCRLALLDLYLRAFKGAPAVRTIEAASAGIGVPVLDCGSRRVPLSGSELQALFDPGLLQRAFDTITRDGALALRSPCGGGALSCRTALVLDSDLVAYRVHDEEWDLAVVLLAGGIINRTLALYFPEAGLVLCPDPDGFAAAHPDLAGRFHRHLARHGAALFAYLGGDRCEPVHFWRGRNAIHLGHVLWNDYSGIERMLAAGAPPPRVLVCDSGSGPEMYGPLDQVFPSLQGRVRREEAPLPGLLDGLYREHALPFRTSALFVSAALRERILAGVPVKGAPAPVLLLGLRTENRTATDLEGFCAALVRHLAARRSPLTLVVDGHNSRESDGGTIWSHGEVSHQGAPIARERALLELIRAEAEGTQVAVVDTIGAPIADSLGWARAARGFVAFWGAGLAKYRWIANRPGLVITSRWNLENLGDLAIYNRPDTMQDPAELAFVSSDAVQDRPDAPVMIRHGDTLAPSLMNFELDLPAVMRELDQAIGPLLSDAATPAVELPRAAAPARRPARKRARSA